MSTEIKTAKDIAHEVYADMSAFPVTPSGSDLRALLVRAIEADRAQRADHLAQGTERHADIEREAALADAEPSQEPPATIEVRTFAEALAKTLDRNVAIASLNNMPESAKGSPMHTALANRIEALGGAL